MFPLEKCMQTLNVLIAQGDSNGIPLAEKAINEFIAAHDGPHRQTGGLHVLEQELTPVWRKAEGAQLDFANVVIEYVDNRMRGLSKPSS
jgi:hypothetical protein